MLDVDFMLKMKKEEQELLFFIIGEREENFVYPVISNHFKRRIDHISIIYDLKGINFLKMYYKLLPILKLGNFIFKSCFPGSLKRLIVLNAGKEYQYNQLIE